MTEQQIGERELLVANTAFYASLEDGDLDALEQLWIDDEAVVCTHPGMPPIRGIRPVLRSWAAMLAGMPYLQFVLTDVATDIRGDVGLVTCTENMLSATDQMPDTVFAGGQAVATNVFRKTDGAWRIWVHHASPVADASDSV